MPYGPQTSSYQYLLNQGTGPSLGINNLWQPWAPQTTATPPAEAATPATATPSGSWLDKLGQFTQANPTALMNLAAGLMAGPTLAQGMSKGFSGVGPGLKDDISLAMANKERARVESMQKNFATWIKGRQVSPEEAAVYNSMTPDQQSQYFSFVTTPKLPDYITVKGEGEFAGEWVFDKIHNTWSRAPGSTGGSQYIFGSSPEGRALSVIANQSPDNVNSPAYAEAVAYIHDKPLTTYAPGPGGALIPTTNYLNRPPGIAAPGQPGSNDSRGGGFPTSPNAPTAPPTPGQVPNQAATSWPVPNTPPPQVPNFGPAPPAPTVDPFGNPLPSNPAAQPPAQTMTAAPTQTSQIATPPVPVQTPVPQTIKLPSGAVQTVPPPAARGLVTANGVQYKEAPANYDYVRDKNGFIEIDENGAPKMVAVGPGAIALEAKMKDMRNQRQILLDNTTKALEVIKQNPGIATGWHNLFLGGPMGAAINSPAYQLNQWLAPLKANLAFARLTDLRNASITGGALGQVSNFEEQMLADSFGSIQGAQSDENLSYNLRRVQQLFAAVTNADPKNFGMSKQITDIGQAVDNGLMDAAAGKAAINALLDKVVAPRTGTLPNGTKYTFIR